MFVLKPTYTNMLSDFLFISIFVYEMQLQISMLKLLTFYFQLFLEANLNEFNFDFSKNTFSWIIVFWNNLKNFASITQIKNQIQYK